MTKPLGQNFKELKESARDIPEVREYLESFSVVVGNLVQARRIQMGLTQAQLANLAGTKQATISKVEAAKENVTMDTLNRIFSALRLSELNPIFADEDAATFTNV